MHRVYMTQPIGKKERNDFHAAGKAQSPDLPLIVYRSRKAACRFTSSRQNHRDLACVLDLRRKLVCRYLR